MDDQRLVQLALEQGHVTPDQVADAQREQRALADRGLDNSIWYLLQDLGHLSEKAANDLRKKTSSSSLRALEVDGYQLQGRLGAGGMGDVFRGRNAAGEEVAVKLLSPKFQANEEYQRRFDREARTSMRLHHPHIARSLGAGVVHGTRYLIMEVVEGPSLKGRIQDQGPINEREALFLLEQMAGALGHSWAEGVLHRDVKPANIIIGLARPGIDEPFCAKLIDFGLAKAWQDAEHSGEESRGGLTGAGLALGTPHYMSPEQASGQADLDQRCDIYGLGASLYHALMGHTMYSGKSSAVIMYKQVTEQIDLSELRKKGARKQLVELLEKMLAKDRGKRLASWADVLAATARVKALLHAGLGTAASAAAGASQAADTAGHKGTANVAKSNPLRMSSEIAGALLAQQHLQAAPAALPETRTLPPPQPSPRTPAGEGLMASRKRTSTRLLTGLAVVGLALGLGTAAWWRVTSSSGPQSATPSSIGEVLRRTAGTPSDVVLAPGTYDTPLRLGAAAAGLHLRASGPGVVMAGITAEPGLRATLAGIDLRGPVVVGPGSQVTLTGGSVGNIAVDGGRLQAEQVVINGRVVVGHQGTFLMMGGSLAGGLHSEDSTVNLRDGRLSGGAHIVRGELHARAFGFTGTAVTPALALDRCGTVSLRQVTLSGGAVGLSADASQIAALDGLTIDATRAGIVWTGPAEPTWGWKGLRITAPSAANGLPMALLTDPQNSSTAIPVPAH